VHTIHVSSCFVVLQQPAVLHTVLAAGCCALTHQDRPWQYSTTGLLSSAVCKPSGSLRQVRNQHLRFPCSTELCQELPVWQTCCTVPLEVLAHCLLLSQHPLDGQKFCCARTSGIKHTPNATLLCCCSDGGPASLHTLIRSSDCHMLVCMLYCQSQSKLSSTV
jgi:hypothetical protein